MFTKHDQLSLSNISHELCLIQIVFKNQWTPFSITAFWLVLISTIAICANIVVPPGDSIHIYYRNTTTKKCCAPGALSIKLYVVLARCLWLGIQRENNGLSNHKHVARTMTSFILRGPALIVSALGLRYLDQEPRHFYLTVWGQKVWGWFLDQNFVLNLKIHFLQTAGGGFAGKLAFLGDFATFLYVNLHNVSYYQISVRSWQIWYHIEALNRGSPFMCRFGGFSGCHGNGSHKLSKNRGKMGISCNLCVT